MMQQKRVRTSGSAENCDVCATPTRPPDVLRTGSESTRYLHPACAERDALGAVMDAANARQQRQPDRPNLRLVDRGA